MKRVVVTGANGFIGRPLCAHLAACGWDVVAVVRGSAALPELKPSALYRVSGLAAQEEWAPVFEGASAVVHLAARVHVMRDTAANPLEEYRRINTLGTLSVARAAAHAGASLFLFLSTIKVNGERTGERPFSERDASAPTDPYALSKWEAEQQLRALASETGIKVGILRPPLVYGPGVKGNLYRMMALVRRRMPLPFGSISNHRSFVGLGNLMSAIEQWISAPAPPAGTFLISDDRDLSTPQLINMIGAAMGIRPILFPCPPALLLGLGRVTGKAGELRRLTESLSIDCTRIKQDLRWRPPFSVEEGIAGSVQGFLRDCS